MTTVSLKLVGYNNDKLIKINKENITMLDIFSYLTEHEMHMNEISQIMFINNGKNITNDISTKYNGTDENPFIIHIFTNKLEIKNEIIKHVFTNPNSSNIDSEKDYENVSEEETYNNNLKIIELFSDNDFVILLNIIKNKPDLLNKVSSYLTNGNIINNFTTIEINNDDFKYPNQLIQLIELLNKLNKEYNEHELKQILYNFEGNLNLSLRYLLNK